MSEVSSNHQISNKIVDAIFNTEHAVSDHAPEKMSTTKKLLLSIFTLGIGAAVIKHREHRAERQAKEVVDLKNKLMTHNFDDVEEPSFITKIDGKDIQVERDQNTGKLKATQLSNGDVTVSTMTQKELVKRLEDDIVTHTDFYGSKAALDVIEDNIPVLPDEYSEEAGRARELGLKVLGQKSGRSPNDFSAIPNRMIANMAHWALNDAIDVNDFMTNNMDAVCNRDLINSEEANLLQARQIQREEAAGGVSTTVTMPNRVNQAPGTAVNPDVQKVRDFLAELVYPKDSFKHDKLLSQPGQMTKDCIMANLDTVILIIKNPEILKQLDPQLADEILSEDSQLSLTALTAMMGDDNSDLSMAAMMIGSLFQAIGVENIPPGITADALGILVGQMSPDHFVSFEKEMNEYINTFFEEIQNIIKDEDHGLSHMLAPGDSDTSDGETVTSEQAANAASGGNAAVSGTSTPPAAETQLTPKQQLENKLNQGIDIDADGYGKFLTIVSQTYFESASNIDKRSMLASYIRETDENSSYGKKMGAILKGAGPIMQKTLQGLNTAGMDPELQLALKDMKSNLTPISDQVIKAHLADVVERSHGQIRNITVKKSLGAASVGQALLCTITTAQGNTKECVIKILRPDVQNRAQREKEIFIAASKQVPGMEMTFAGQLKRITEELDLTKEAENIKHGQVYTKAGFTKVKSMLLNPLVDTTPNVMVLERAPGNTVDSMIEQLGQRILDIKSEFAQKDENGNVIFNEAGDVVYRSDLSQEDLVKLQDKLLAVYDEYKQCQEQLLQLSNMWVTQGLYAESGFYHGDLHAGNIMFDKDAGTTIIDFGNATKLDSKQQIDVTKMAISASVADPSLFLKAYRNLLTNEGKAKFDELQADGHRVKKVVEEVFNIDNKMENTGLRIAVVLQELQKIGLELPAPIFNFSQCQMRLQNTVDTMNTALEQIRRDITNVIQGSNVFAPEKYLIETEEKIVRRVKQYRTSAIEDKKVKVRIRNYISDEIKKAIDSYKHDIQDPARLSLIFHHLLMPSTQGIQDANRLLDRLESQNNGLADIKVRFLEKAENFMANARTLIDRNSNSEFGKKEVVQALLAKAMGLEDDRIMRQIVLKVDANADEAASGEAAATPQAVQEAFEEAKALLNSMFEDYKEYVELFTKMAVGSVISGAAHTYDVVTACSAHDDTFYDAMADVVDANFHSSLHRIGLLNALRYWRRV